MMRTLLALAFLIALPLSAAAHKLSDSFLQVSVAGPAIAGQWEMALRDLDHAVTLDSNGDGKLTWGEVRQKQREIEDYALRRLRLISAGESCPLRAGEHLLSRRADGIYAVLHFTADCAAPVRALEISYALFFDLDPSHRGLLSLAAGGVAQEAVFAPDTASQSFRIDP